MTPGSDVATELRSFVRSAGRDLDMGLSIGPADMGSEFARLASSYLREAQSAYRQFLVQPDALPRVIEAVGKCQVALRLAGIDPDDVYDIDHPESE